MKRVGLTTFPYRVGDTYFYFYIVDEELRHKKEFYSLLYSNINDTANATRRLVINLTLKVIFSYP